MSVLELLSRKLSVQGASVQRGSGGVPVLTPGDVAGMLAGLARGPVALAYAKLAGDERAGHEVYAILHVLASDWSRIERWQVPRGSGQVGQLARLVRDDLLLSRALLGERAAAQFVGVSRHAWRAVWRERHGRLLAVAVGWECDVVERLRRELYLDVG